MINTDDDGGSEEEGVEADEDDSGEEDATGLSTDALCSSGGGVGTARE